MQAVVRVLSWSLQVLAIVLVFMSLVFMPSGVTGYVYGDEGGPFIESICSGCTNSVCPLSLPCNDVKCPEGDFCRSCNCKPTGSSCTCQ